MAKVGPEAFSCACCLRRLLPWCGGGAETVGVVVGSSFPHPLPLALPLQGA